MIRRVIDWLMRLFRGPQSVAPTGDFLSFGHPKWVGGGRVFAFPVFYHHAGGGVELVLDYPDFAEEVS